MVSIVGWDDVGVGEERWASILENMLELSILVTFEVKDDTNGYNVHRICNKHNACSYEYSCFAWVVYPITRLWDYFAYPEGNLVEDLAWLDYLADASSYYPSPFSFSWG